jgi:hypothetical protein
LVHPIKARDVARWERMQRLGFWMYVLLYGVLAWGVPMFIVMTFFIYQRPGGRLTLGLILFSGCIWILGGAAFGWLMWKASEKKYKKITAQTERPKT